jgi:MoaA/NifB/PqqE/SkfB family radical SAM enzyme
MCLVRYRPTPNRADGAMTIETFRSILHDLDGVERLTLQGLGEPMLAPHLVEMVREAAARGIRVGFNTNATLLSRRRGRELLDAGLGWLHISLDGATAATYEAIRDGADFDRVTRNIGGFMELVRPMSDPPTVSIVAVVMRRNLHELPAIVELAARWGIASVRFQNLSHDFGDTGGDPAYGAIRRFTRAEALWIGEDQGPATSAFERALDRGRALGVRVRVPHLGTRAPTRHTDEPGCTWPFEQSYLTHDGLVQPCCMVMGADRATLGDAVRDGFGAVWRGEEYAAFRAALMTGDPPDVCRGCALYRDVS